MEKDRLKKVFSPIVRRASAAASGMLADFWCVPAVRRTLRVNIDAQDYDTLDLLIKIRVLSFALLTSPVLSLIPFAITNNKRLGLINFALGTVSIVLWVFVFKRYRSNACPIELIKNGAFATILLSIILGGLLVFASLLALPANNLVALYLFLQLFTGIPFALITGVDSKLSGWVLRGITRQDDASVSPNAELRRCKSAGVTAATAAGALFWCTIIFFHNSASGEPGWYAVLFGLNVLPAIVLKNAVRSLAKRLQERPILRGTILICSNLGNGITEIKESIIAVGFLEGLLQFSQFYFSISAVKALFELVPQHSLLLIAIPLMFYLVNGIEQFGARLFSIYNRRSFSRGKGDSVRQRQLASLTILLIAASCFALHVIVWRSFGWSGFFDVAAYCVFNVIKGFAGGLSEEWNEAIVRHYPQHDEARFSTSAALLGRLYQILAIATFFYLNQLANSENWKQSLTVLQNDNPITRAFVSTLTVFLLFLFAGNILAYHWLGHGNQQHKTIWAIIAEAVLEQKERTALFNQFLRMLFVVSLILANLLSLKLVDYKGLLFTHGSIFYIALFVLINLISVFESVEAAIKTVFLGTTLYLVVYAALVFSARLPGHLVNEPPLQTSAYNDLVGNIANLFLASLCGYVVTVILNLGLLRMLARHFSGKSPVIVGAVVTFICQAIDTVIFVSVGFGRSKDVDLTSMFIGQFSVKFLVYLMMYFPLYYLIKLLKNWIGSHGPTPQGLREFA